MMLKAVIRKVRFSLLRLNPKKLLWAFQKIKIHPAATIAWSAELDAGGGDGSLNIGDGTIIDKGVIIRCYSGLIRIGKNCSINPYSIIYGGGGLLIGDGVRIAAHVVIVPSNHNFDDIHTPIYKQGLKCKGIVIEDDVWIGAGAKILDGVTLGRGVVVAAGAVVNRSVPAFSIVGGVPAKTLRNRKMEDEKNDN